MKKEVKALLGSAAIAVGIAVAAPASAQGIPTFDTSTYVQTLATVTNTTKMIEQGVQQIQQAEQTFNSLSKLTNINSVASILNDPNVRNVLPSQATDVATLLNGDTTKLGALGQLAQQFQQKYGLQQSTPPTSADSAYAAALKASTGTAATQMALGSNTLAIAQTRTQGLEQLRQQLDSAKDPKDVMDIQARIAVEEAHLQNDALKFQAIQMSQQAQDALSLAGARAARGRATAAFVAQNVPSSN